MCVCVCVCHLLTHSLTPWSRVLLDKLTVFQLVKKFPTLYGTRRFIPSIHKCPPPVYPEPTRSSPYPQIPLAENPP